MAKNIVPTALPPSLSKRLSTSSITFMRLEKESAQHVRWDEVDVRGFQHRHVLLDEEHPHHLAPIVLGHGHEARKASIELTVLFPCRFNRFGTLLLVVTPHDYYWSRDLSESCAEGVGGETLRGVCLNNKRNKGHASAECSDAALVRGRGIFVQFCAACCDRAAYRSRLVTDPGFLLLITN